MSQPPMPEPPTGRDTELESDLFPEGDRWIAQLALDAGFSQDEVVWMLTLPEALSDSEVDRVSLGADIVSADG